MIEQSVEPGSSDQKLFIRWYKVAGAAVVMAFSVVAVVLYYEIYRWFVR